MRKILKILGIAGSITAAGLIATHRGSGPSTPPVDHTAEWTQACSDIFQQLLERQIHADESDTCVQKARAGAQDSDLRNWVRDTDEYRALQAKKAQPPTPTLQPVHGDGRIFRTADGQPWRYKGVTAFGLLARFARGEDINDFLDAYKGFNVLRVWPYVPVADWGATAWDVVDVATIRRFIDDVNARGWYVELTLLTDADPARLAWAQTLVPQLVQGGCPAGLLFEGANEPSTHKQWPLNTSSPSITAIDTPALRSVLAASGCLYASGDYEDSARAYGSYLTAHTARDGAWPRRSHDALEYFSGGGPNSPSDPPHRVPIVLDEPPKPADVGMTADDARAYFGGAALFGGGATWHCDTCRFGQLPRPDEASLAAVALAALNAFPVDAANGPYRRIVEPGQSDAARTYVVGDFMVRSQQQGRTAPEPGWTPIDADGILWRK